jgi:hypothetical protein
MRREVSVESLDKLSILAFWGEFSTMEATLLSTSQDANREHRTTA